MRKRDKEVAVSVGVAAVTIAVWMVYRRRKKNQRQGTTKQKDTAVETKTRSLDLTTNGSSSLEQDFKQSAKKSKELKNLQNGDKLMLYGLYKQATVGDVSVEQEPSRYNMIQHAKFEAWSKFEGMPKQEAMQKYVQAITAFASGQPMEYTTEDLDMYNAMGSRPSTLLHMDDGGDTKQQPATTPSQILRQATCDGNLELLRATLEHDDVLNVDAADESGQTALHFAADRGSLEGVEMLLEAGADANATDLDGISVLQTSVIAGHYKVASLLIQNGANPHAKDKDGESAYSCAHENGASPEMKKLFTDIPELGD